MLNICADASFEPVAHPKKDSRGSTCEHTSFQTFILKGRTNGFCSKYLGQA